MKTLFEFGIVAKALIAFCLTAVFVVGADNAAKEAYDRGEFQEALAAFTQAIKIGTSDATVHSAR
ncbi:MAG: tetratricopeptide repeat protein [Helicobacteraceae bacterium]|jgi:hypothetical protein|nr:tetratricopeptide repeat protein [Helicobacteraceae bacterium]